MPWCGVWWRRRRTKGCGGERGGAGRRRARRRGGRLDQCGAAEGGAALIGVALPIIGNCALIPNVSPQLYSIAPSRSRLIGIGLTTVWNQQEGRPRRGDDLFRRLVCPSHKEKEAMLRCEMRERKGREAGRSCSRSASATSVYVRPPRIWLAMKSLRSVISVKQVPYFEVTRPRLMTRPVGLINWPEYYTGAVVKSR